MSREHTSPKTTPPDFTEQARQLVKQIQSVVTFTATTSLLFASHRNIEEGDYFRCLRCNGESLHGSQRATGNVAHEGGCPVALAYKLWSENAIASFASQTSTDHLIEQAAQVAKDYIELKGDKLHLWINKYGHVSLTDAIRSLGKEK